MALSQTTIGIQAGWWQSAEFSNCYAECLSLCQESSCCMSLCWIRLCKWHFHNKTSCFE